MSNNNELQEKFRKHLEEQKNPNQNKTAGQTEGPSEDESFDDKIKKLEDEIKNLKESSQKTKTSQNHLKQEVKSSNIELTDAQKKAKELRIASIYKQIDQKKAEQETLLKNKEQLILEKKFDIFAEKAHNKSLNELRNSIYDLKESIKKIENPDYTNTLRTNKIETQTPPNNLLQIIGGILFLCFLGVGFYGAFFYKNPNNQPIKKDPDTADIERQFSPWDGAHHQLSKQAKNFLKFPDTYEHINTVYFRNNEKREITVKTTFIGQNAFGVKQRSCIMATYSFYGTELTNPTPC